MIFASKLWLSKLFSQTHAQTDSAMFLQTFMPRSFHETPETRQTLKIEKVLICPVDHQTYVLKPRLEVYRSAVCFTVAINYKTFKCN